MGSASLAFVYGAIGRWFTYVSVVTIVGTASVSVGIRGAWRRSTDSSVDQTERRLLRTAVAAALVLLGATMWRLYAQAYSAFGIEESVTWDDVRIVAFHTAWGHGWLWQAVAAALAGLVLTSAIKVADPKAAHLREILVTTAAVAVVLVAPLTGHAMAREGAVWLSVALQMLHVAGVGLWIGTLLIIMTLIRPSGDAVFVAAVRAFSPIALAAVSTIVLTGLFTAIIYLDSLSDLWSGAYGRTLILKLVLFAAVAALGAYNWRRLKPVLEQEGRVRTLNRTARVELLIAGLTLAVTAVLVALPLVHDS